MLSLLISAGIAGAPTTSGNVEFNISISKDASISISDLCLSSGTILQFAPGINGLDEDAYANAINVCTANSTVGEWNITNIGNIPAYLYAKLNESAPAGIVIAIGNQESYNDVNYVNLTTDDIEWVGSPLAKSGNTKFWQRVAADATATGGTEDTLKIILTSLPEEQ